MSSAADRLPSLSKFSSRFLSNCSAATLASPSLTAVQKILIVVTMCPNQSAKKQLRDFTTTYDYLKVI